MFPGYVCSHSDKHAATCSFHVHHFADLIEICCFNVTVVISS